MSVFLRRFLENKKMIFMMICIVFGLAIVFGFFVYDFTNQNIKSFLDKVFYLEYDQYINNYQLYLIFNVLYILVCTYLSSSYMGYIGILFFVFIKGIQISFSFIYTFSVVDIQLLVVLLLIIEFLLEILFVFVVSGMAIYLSIYVCLIAFYLEQNFHIKNVINFRLNHLIVSLLLLSISLALRLYFIPLFS